MKHSRLRIALLGLFCGTSALHADILVLKNGSRIEGSIIEEAPDSIRMRYRLTPKIWDEKNFATAEIEKVIKQSPQEVEIVELRKLTQTPDLLPADKYEQIIQDRLRPFVNKYKDTKEAAEAETIIAQLQEEKAKVSAGQVKLEGRWLTADEARRDDYNIRAYKLLTAMREKFNEQEWVLGMREFDKFYNIRTGFPASVYYPVAIAEAIAALDKYEPIVSQWAQQQPEAVKTRDAGLAKLVEPDLSRTKSAIDRENSAWKTTYDAERRSGIRWLHPSRYDIRSLQETLRVIAAERTRLMSYDLEALRAQNAALSNALRAIAGGDVIEAEAAIERASSLPPGNPREFVTVVNDVRMRLGTVRMQQLRNQAATGGMTRGSTALGGTVSSEVDDRVARLLAQNNVQAGGAPNAAVAQPGAPANAAQPGAPANAGQPGAPGAMPAPGARPAAPGTVPTAPGVTPTAAQGRPMQAAQAQQRPMQPPPPVAQAAAMPVVVQEESNLQTYLLIGAGVLILLLGVALLKQRKQMQA